MPLDFLYSEREIQEGDPDVTLALLMQMRRAFSNVSASCACAGVHVQ